MTTLYAIAHFMNTICHSEILQGIYHLSNKDLSTFTFFIIGLLICQVFLFSLTSNAFCNNFLDWNNCFVYHIPIFIDLKTRPFISYPLFQHTGKGQCNENFVLFYLSTNYNTSTQLTLPSYTVVAWNIYKIRN